VQQAVENQMDAERATVANRRNDISTVFEDDLHTGPVLTRRMPSL
jgi:hypothetical protein